MHLHSNGLLLGEGPRGPGHLDFEDSGNYGEALRLVEHRGIYVILNIHTYIYTYINTLVGNTHLYIVLL